MARAGTIRMLAGLLLTATAFADSHTGLRYASRKDALFDLETPAGAGPFTVVIAVHGGGWSAGSRADALPFCRAMVQSGLACAAIDYRLAPATRFSGQIEDLREAVAFLLRNARELKLNSQGVVLAGESAGGHLVSWLGASRPPGIRVLGVIAFSAPTDLIALGEPGRALGVVPPEVADLLGIKGWGPRDIELMKSVSPFFAIRAGAAPFLIIHGQADQLVPAVQSQAFCDELRRTGNRCEIIMVPDARHGLWGEDQFDRWKASWLSPTVDWIAKTGRKIE